MTPRLRCALLSLGLALGVAACAEESVPVAPSEGAIRDDAYHHAGLGWTMPIPDGWHALPGSEIDRINNQGRQMLETSMGGPVVDASVTLLYLRASPTSIFTSATELHDEARDGPYAETQNAVIDIILESYRDAGIPIRHARERESIDGVRFEVLHVTLLSPDGATVIGRQWMYDALLGSQALMVSITTNAEKKDRKTMLAAWRASQFDPAAWQRSPTGGSCGFRPGVLTEFSSS